MNSEINKKQKKAPSFKDYNTFVTQIKIANIRLVSAQVKILDDSYFPASPKVNWRMRASYKKAEEQFNVCHRYYVKIFDKETSETKAQISVAFQVVYSSKIPISDELFEIFKTRNLPLNTWPYFREFIHNTTMRMGWSPLIAPTYVV